MSQMSQDRVQSAAFAAPCLSHVGQVFVDSWTGGSSAQGKTPFWRVLFSHWEWRRLGLCGMLEHLPQQHGYFYPPTDSP